MVTELLTMFEAAQVAGVSETTIQKYAQMGKLFIAEKGKRGRFYFTRQEVLRWAKRFKDERRYRTERLRTHSRALTQVNGMMVPGQLECERKDEADRERLFLAVHGADVDIAIAALCELYYKYGRLRLPLEEQRLGYSLERKIYAENRTATGL